MIGILLLAAVAALLVAGKWSHNAWKLEQYQIHGRHARRSGSLDQLSARQIKARIALQAKYNFTEADYL